MAGTVVLIDHPLVQHKLTLLRKAETSAAVFRTLLREISLLLAYEVTRDMPLTYVRIQTPLASMQAPVLAGKKLVVVSILRAGNGILDGMLELIPSARVGHIGLYRDPKTHVAIEYYFKVPEDIAERDVLVVDPMLATGNSAVAALHRLKDSGAKTLKFVCLLAAPRALDMCMSSTPMCPYTPLRLTSVSMRTTISSLALGTQGTAFLARSRNKIPTQYSVL